MRDYEGVLKLLVADGLETIRKEQEMGRVSANTTASQIIEYRNRLLYWSVIIKDQQLVKQLLAHNALESSTTMDIIQNIKLSGKGKTGYCRSNVRAVYDSLKYEFELSRDTIY